jgi:GTPase SAR1 family protein
MPIAVLGNKVDLRDSGEAKDFVTQEEVKGFIADLKKQFEMHYEIPYLETSAKTGANVDESFAMLATSIRAVLASA